MLSTKAIESSGSAGHYFYEKDNYYLKDSPEAQEKTTWWGKGAEKLELSGEVNKDKFVEILEGKLADNVQLGRIRNGEREHRPGIDLTFSAPKSVSILAEVGQDKRIYQAHENAVNTALTYIERQCAQTRISINGKNEFIDTGNLIVAKFRHDTSRELDPQLHSHCVVMNATLRPDGEWRSLARQNHNVNIDGNSNGFLERIYNNQKYYGAIYRAALAYEIKELGYEIHKTHSDGRFEIVGVPEDLISDFSKRRHQIENMLAEKGTTSAKAASIATLETRSEKKAVDRVELHDIWNNHIKSLDINIEKIIDNSKNNIRSEHYIKKDAKQALEFAINHLSEREASFNRKDVEKVALSYAQGDVLPNQISKTIDDFQQQNILLKAIAIEGQESFTTHQALQLEKSTIDLMQTSKASVDSIVSIERLNTTLAAKEYLTSGQKEAIKLILNTNDRVIGVQGFPGTGKTTLLKNVYELATMEDYSIKGLAVSAAAARKIETETGIVSQTLSSYLLALTIKKENPDDKTILVVDEASMSSTTQIHNLLELTKEKNARIILVGDRKQHGSIEAGKPFAQLQDAGMKTVYMKEILRQKNADLLLAVKLALQDEIPKAIDKIKDNVYEIPNKHDRLSQIAIDFLSLPSSKRDNAKIATTTREERDILNNLVRSGLKAEGVFHGKEITTKILDSKDLTHAQKTFSESYEVGDIVRFNKTYTSLGIEHKDYLTVIATDHKNNIISLQKDNEIVKWNPNEVGGKRQGVIEVYQEKERQLAKGDLIRWTRNDKKNDILNVEHGRVIGINGDKAKIELLNREKIERPTKNMQQKISMKSSSYKNDTKNTFKNPVLTINLRDKKFQHWNHAYAATGYSLQGETCNKIFIAQNSAFKDITNQRAFIVAISRAKENAYLYTDNKKEYVKTLQKYSGEKSSALESLGEKTIKPNCNQTISATISKTIFNYKINEICLKNKVSNFVKNDKSVEKIIKKYGQHESKTLEKNNIQIKNEKINTPQKNSRTIERQSNDIGEL